MKKIVMNLMLTGVLIAFVTPGLAAPKGAGLSEKYFVHELICTGKWNKNPPQYHPNYEQAALLVVSLQSVRAKDCSLADSTATSDSFAFIGNKLVPPIHTPDYLGSWYSHSIFKTGNELVLPVGINAGNPITLNIDSTETVNGNQVDHLSGRAVIYDDYYYDLTCTAKVSNGRTGIIINATKDCPIESTAQAFRRFKINQALRLLEKIPASGYDNRALCTLENQVFALYPKSHWSETANKIATGTIEDFPSKVSDEGPSIKLLSQRPIKKGERPSPYPNGELVSGDADNGIYAVRGRVDGKLADVCLVEYKALLESVQ